MNRRDFSLFMIGMVFATLIMLVSITIGNIWRFLK